MPTWQVACPDSLWCCCYVVLCCVALWLREEVQALSKAVKEHGMALVVFAEW
jgi:hypothetical protein